LMSLCSIYYG